MFRLLERPAEFPGLALLETTRQKDGRGAFMELYTSSRFRELGIEDDFVQDNLSMSERGVLRGLHFQRIRPQAKLVTALEGEVFDVVVDLREGSPSFARWKGFRLSGGTGRLLYIPKGFAHGFLVLSAKALFLYKCTDYYCPEGEGGVRWDDPDLAIPWPLEEGPPNLSRKDSELPLLSEGVPAFPSDRPPGRLP